MFRSPNAGIRRSAFIAAVFLTGFASSALGGDWQPITGSQSQTTTPRPPSQPSGSGGGYGIPTWGRGGGWPGEPDHPHPPVTSTAPVTANCGLRIDPPTAQAGEYATVVATLSNTVLRDLGRMDLLVGGQVASGVTRQGGSFTYFFRVPEGERQVDVSLTAYASRTGAYGQIGVLCSATASLTVINLTLDAAKKIGSGRMFSAAAILVGGQPPFDFTWWPSGRAQTQGNKSTYFNNFEDPGAKTLTVEVTDGAGRRLRRSARFEVFECAHLQVGGPSELKSGEKGTWSISFPSKFPPINILASYGGLYAVRSEPEASVSFEANPEANGVVVSAVDESGCDRSTVTFPVKVIAASVPTPPTPAPATGRGAATDGCRDVNGCACPGGGRTWQVGQTCCGSVICQPGARCIAPGNCR